MLCDNYAFCPQVVAVVLFGHKYVTLCRMQSSALCTHLLAVCDSLHGPYIGIQALVLLLQFLLKLIFGSIVLSTCLLTASIHATLISMWPAVHDRMTQVATLKNS